MAVGMGEVDGGFLVGTGIEKLGMLSGLIR